MAKHRVIRAGDKFIPFVGEETPEELQAIELMGTYMPHVTVRLEDYECDCAEWMANQDTFTRDQVLKIIACPVHTFTH